MRSRPLRSMHALRTPWALLFDARKASGVTRLWLREQALAHARWWALALAALLLPLFPEATRGLAVMLLLALAGGNALVTRLLSHGPAAPCFPAAQRLATTVEWSGGLAAIALRSGQPHTAAPAVTLLLLVVSGYRYRLRGVAGGLLAAWLATALLTLAQARMHGLLTPAEAWAQAVDWAAVNALLALALTVMIVVNDDERAAARVAHVTDLRAMEARHVAERCALEARHAAELDAFRRERSGLSEREWTLLPVLARGQTYAQAADELGVELETIRTYVRRIGAKLDAHGRRAIVAEARKRGWLDDAPRAPQPDA